VERLSSGLRVNRSADDAAGLSIRELMRENVASLNQGIRNANDAVSMIQTADGALSVIDEKLIRMKELAEQAATGTYSAEQRLMINEEFHLMAEEINRIAAATDFNGIKLLDGSLSGTHDGSKLSSTEAAKIHFDPENDSAEDYYYISMGDASIAGLGLGEATEDGIAGILTFSWNQVNVFPIIASGSTNVHFAVGTVYGANNAIQVFKNDGTHIAGSILSDAEWMAAGYNTSNINSLLTEANGFDSTATYNGSNVNGTGADLTYTTTGSYPPYVMQNVTSDGNITYSGNGYISGLRGDGGCEH
jgi:flagellin